MSGFEVTLLGVTVAAVSALATVLMTPRGITRQEVAQLLEAQMQMCNQLSVERHRMDAVRNGKLERIEEKAATKQDLKELKEELLARIERLESKMEACYERILTKN